MEKHQQNRYGKQPLSQAQKQTVSHLKLSEEAFSAVEGLRQLSKGFGKVTKRLEKGFNNLPNIASSRLISGTGRCEQFGGLVTEEDWYHWALFAEPGHEKAPTDEDEIQPSRIIMLGVELWRETAAHSFWRYNKCALVYVGHQPFSQATKSNLWMADMRKAGRIGNSSERYRLEESILWVEKTPHPGTQQPLAELCWFYIMPLSSISVPNIINSDIVKPIHCLLSGRSVEEAFRKAQHIIRDYPNPNKLKVKA